MFLFLCFSVSCNIRFTLTFENSCNSSWGSGRLNSGCMFTPQGEGKSGRAEGSHEPPVSSNHFYKTAAAGGYTETLKRTKNPNFGSHGKPQGWYLYNVCESCSGNKTMVTLTCLPTFLCMVQCLQRHFSGWYSVVLDRRLRMGKAMALCDWKRQLRAWRAWRNVVWAEQKQREVARTEEDLRTENR